ncbi:hypothetical protein QE152_g35184 [Popillia japonica]|uniref:Ribosome biogenesis protein NOP53 n=1 Tax=Popillia japonica TaxID=7064 RepID=A0AAW1IGL0_POPJA
MEKEATKKIPNPDNTADKQQMEDIVQAKPSPFEVRLPHKEGTKTSLVERLFERRKQRNLARLPYVKQPKGRYDPIRSGLNSMYATSIKTLRQRKQERRLKSIRPKVSYESGGNSET